MLLPSQPSRLLIRIFLLLELFVLPLVRSAGTVSIKSDAGYASERSCAQNCLWGASDVLIYLGCSNTNGWLNDCYCRADLQSSAYYFITSCVNKACSSNAADLSGASSVYSTYCATAVGAVPANVPAATTASSNPATNTVLVVTTVVSVSGTSRTLDTTLSSIFTSAPPSSTPTYTTSPRTTTIHSTSTIAPDTTGIPTSGKGGLSTSDKIALGVGIGIGLPTLLVAIIAICLKA